MNKTKYIFLIFALFLFQQSAWSQIQTLENPEEWVEMINEKTKELKSLYADFKQQKVLSFLEAPVVSKGKFWFHEPDKIRWEYQDPYQYIMIMSGGALTVKDQGDEYTTDLSANKMFEQMNGLIAGSIQGKLLDNDQDYSKEFYENATNIIVRFIPNNQQLLAYLDYIEIWFDKQILEVDSLIMHEPSGDFTKMIFSNRQINQSISADVFQ